MWHQKTLSICIVFAAMSQVTVKAESMVKTVWFLPRSRNELLIEFLNSPRLSLDILK
jgi:hypothetical protein